MLNVAHQRMCYCAPALGFAVVTGLYMLLVCLQTDVCGIRGTEGNGLQAGGCLQLTLPCVGQT